MDITITTVRPFTDNDKASCIVAVMQTDKRIHPDKQRHLAFEFRASETVFIVDDYAGERYEDYYVESDHVPFSTQSYLSAMKVLNPAEDKFVIHLGQLDIGQIVDRDLMAYVLQIPKEFIETEYPIQFVSIRDRHLLVPIDSLIHLQEMKPNNDLIKAICERNNCESVYVYTGDTYNQTSEFHARSFNPHARGKEDVVSGSGAGALVGYWAYYNNDYLSSYIVEQGKSEDSLSYIEVNPGKMLDDEVIIRGSAYIIKTQKASFE